VSEVTPFQPVPTHRTELSPSSGSQNALYFIHRARHEDRHPHWNDDSGNRFRSYGNENWDFDNQGLMRAVTPA
jgi:hypothetical protein